MIYDLFKVDVTSRQFTLDRAAIAQLVDRQAEKTGATSIARCDQGVLFFSHSRPFSANSFPVCAVLGDSAKLFARVNALCNLSRKKSREVAAHFRADL